MTKDSDWVYKSLCIFDDTLYKMYLRPREEYCLMSIGKE
jgi:hypothetical protein